MTYTIEEYKEKIQDIKDSPDLTDAEKTKFIGKVEDLIKDLEKKETPKKETKTVSIKKEPKKASQAEQTKLLRRYILANSKTISELSIKKSGTAYHISYSTSDNQPLNEMLIFLREHLTQRDSNNNQITPKKLIIDGYLIEPRYYLTSNFNQDTKTKTVSIKKEPKKASQSKKTTQSNKSEARHLPMVIRTQEHPKNKEVKANDLESEFAVKYVKSFLLMIGKKKLRKNLQSLLNRINKSADAKEIRAKSIHSEAINYVAQSLVAALNTNYSTFIFKLDKIGSEILEPYMNTKEALPNRLLRSFYNSQNKKFSKTHANLLKRLEKIENQDNPFSIEISEAIKTLKTAERNNSTIKATKPTLRGLEGICKGHKNDPVKDKRCRAIMASIRNRTNKPINRRKKNTNLNGLKNINPKAVIAGAASGAIGGMIGTMVQQSLSGVELLEVDYETMDLSFDFSKIGLDDMPKNASILVYGKPKHGKSTFALQLANELSKKGKLLYVANEEMMSDGKPSKSLQDRVKRIGYTPTMRFSKNLDVQLTDFQFIVIDSINALGLDIEAWRRLRNAYPNTFFVLVSQVTKSGVFRGSQEWAHDVDVIVDVKDGKADIMGRFGSGEYEIFNQNIL